MSTALMIDRGTVAASTQHAELGVGENPRTRRYAVNPAVSLLEAHPTLSGRQRAIIPFGVPLVFETFNKMKTRNWSVDAEDKSPPFVETDLTAKDAIENVKIAAFQGSRDMGFRELSALTALTDAEADNMLAALLPALDPADCRYGAENTAEMTYERFVTVDGERVAQAYSVEAFRCLSCTLNWLESEACKALAPAGTLLGALRAQLLDAYTVNESFFKAKWQEWTAEMSKRDKGENGLTVLGEDHEHVMYQLHQTAPADRAAEVIASTQKANADAMKEGFREVAQEMRAAMAPAQPALDVNEIIRLAKEAAKEELRAEIEAEKTQKPKGK